MSVLELSEEGDSLAIDIVVPCPTCSRALRISTRAQAVVETALELPLDDVDELYD
ncbi:hypothetical protein [Haloarchaeobius baliensis]|uniref:hypothetical protein n=1 Tax=Haloarchaeobius baliensis TaxID=1670458 RepID=UPI003F885CEA